MRKTINAGMMIPKGYGIAYYEPWSDRTVCYPIPLNIIISLARRIWVWFMWGYGVQKTQRDHYI